MAISRERKEELLQEYREQLEQSQGMILAHYSGLTVAQMETLRRQARGEEGYVFVIKNTLLEKALEERDVAAPEEMLTGPTIVAFTHQDTPPLAKIFRDFSGEVEEGKFTLRGAFVDGRFYNATQARTLADLPTRDQLFARVLGTINAPATQVAGVVAGGVRQVLNVLQAYVDKLEEGGTTAEAAA
ncbi:MAG: 50S ribosomal protein L10 [Anaerolineales bacterium]